MWPPTDHLRAPPIQMIVAIDLQSIRPMSIYRIAAAGLMLAMSACVASTGSDAVDSGVGDTRPDVRGEDVRAPDCGAISSGPPVFIVSNTLGLADCKAHFSILGDAGATSLDDGGVYLCNGQRAFDCPAETADAAAACTYALTGATGYQPFVPWGAAEAVFRTRRPSGIRVRRRGRSPNGSRRLRHADDASVVTVQLKQLDASSK